FNASSAREKFITFWELLPLFTNLWDELSPSSVRDFIQRVNNVGSVFWGLLILFAPVSVILWIKTNIFGKYLAKTVFVDAVKIDHDLHENLKNRKHKTSIWPLVALGVLIILAISNPSTQEFQAYYAQKEKAAIELKNLNRTNLVIFSHYQIKDMGKTYWGVLGNFFP
ncbi:hypothetical protein KJ068_24870, partial [bacterium]|nr:hypothetical protein [bacterium]